MNDCKILDACLKLNVVCQCSQSRLMRVLLFGHAMRSPAVAGATHVPSRSDLIRFARRLDSVVRVRR